MLTEFRRKKLLFILTVKAFFRTYSAGLRRARSSLTHFQLLKFPNLNPSVLIPRRDGGAKRVSVNHVPCISCGRKVVTSRYDPHAGSLEFRVDSKAGGEGGNTHRVYGPDVPIPLSNIANLLLLKLSDTISGGRSYPDRITRHNQIKINKSKC